MIGKVIAKIREDKDVSKTDLSKVINIDVGHLTHIEKEERNPSHKALKGICTALDVPFQPLMYTYDKDLTDEQDGYKMASHIKYDSIPIISSIDGFAACPPEMRAATCVLKVSNDDMAPKYKAGDSVFIELNAPLNSKDIGIFEYDGNIMMRKFIVRRNDIVLRAESDDVPEIVVTKDDNFYIIGKVLGLMK